MSDATGAEESEEYDARQCESSKTEVRVNDGNRAADDLLDPAQT